MMANEFLVLGAMRRQRLKGAPREFGRWVFRRGLKLRGEEKNRPAEMPPARLRTLNFQARRRSGCAPAESYPPLVKGKLKWRRRSAKKNYKNHVSLKFLAEYFEATEWCLFKSGHWLDRGIPLSTCLREEF